MSDEQGDYQIENDQIKTLLRDIGGTLKEAMPEGWGFNLMIFSYGEGGAMFYIASARRDDMVRAFREFLQKQEIEAGTEAGTDETAANIIGRLINHCTIEMTREESKRDWDAVVGEATAYLLRALREHPDSAKEFWDRAKRDGLVT